MGRSWLFLTPWLLAAMPITNQSERKVLLKLSPIQYKWLENRAKKNNRARLREAVEIIEQERLRERALRRSATGILSARGGAA